MRFSEEELHELERVGAESFAELHASLARHGIDAHYEANGVLWIATEQYQVDEIDEEVELIRRFGGDARPLDAEETRREVATPRALGGVWHRDAGGVLDPVALAYGLRRACSSSACASTRARPSRGLARESGAVVLACPDGRVRAQRVVLATSAYPPLLRSVRRRMLPVYDYVLMTERLSDAQLASIGWATARASRTAATSSTTSG